MAKGKKPPAKAKLTVVDGGKSKHEVVNYYPPGHPEGPPLPEDSGAPAGAP